MPNLRYHPVLGDVDVHVTSAEPTRLLVVGDEVPDTMAAAASTRLVANPEIPLPTGTYIFASLDG